MKKQVLLIEDDDAMRASLAQTLDLEGITVIVANGLSQARRAIRANFSGIILSDIRMPHDDGFAVLAHVKSVDTDLPVVMLTGEADVPMALRAMKEGAYDFLEKPCLSDTLLEVLDRALSFRDVVLQKRQLEREIKRNDPAALHFPGRSDATRSIQSELRRLANASTNVIIKGDEGTGKKLAAYTLHELGAEGAKFVGYNFANATSSIRECTIPSGMVNFSVKSAHLAKAQDLEWLAEKRKQNAELRLLVSGRGEFTNSNAAGSFFITPEFDEITLPSLRARRKDLPIIFEQVLRQMVRNLDLDMPNVPDDIYTQLSSRDWGGNLIELREFAKSFIDALSKDVSLTAQLTLSQRMENYEKFLLVETLRNTGGKAAQAAEQLGLPRKTFYDRLTRYEIRPKDFK